jgi:hypothetical protein
MHKLNESKHIPTSHFLRHGKCFALQLYHNLCTAFGVPLMMVGSNRKSVDFQILFDAPNSDGDESVWLVSTATTRRLPFMHPGIPRHPQQPTLLCTFCNCALHTSVATTLRLSRPYRHLIPGQFCYTSAFTLPLPRPHLLSAWFAPNVLTMASVSSLDQDMKNLRMSRYTPQAANETRGWIEDVLGERLPSGDLLDALKDGTVLCRCVQHSPDATHINFRVTYSF